MPKACETTVSGLGLKKKKKKKKLPLAVIRPYPGQLNLILRLQWLQWGQTAAQTGVVPMSHMWAEGLVLGSREVGGDACGRAVPGQSSASPAPSHSELDTVLCCSLPASRSCPDGIKAGHGTAGCCTQLWTLQQSKDRDLLELSPKEWQQVHHGIE